LKQLISRDPAALLAQLGFDQIDTQNPDSSRWNQTVAAAAQTEIRESKAAIFKRYKDGEINEEEFASAITELNAQVPSIYARIAQNTN
jgi:hypothetical protein